MNITSKDGTQIRLAVSHHHSSAAAMTAALEPSMDNSTFSFALKGVEPAMSMGISAYSQPEDAVLDRTESFHVTQPASERGFSALQIRSVMAELCSAVRSALDDERSTAEESLRRALEALKEMGGTETEPKEQVRKVTNHVEANLDRPIRNEELATLVRLNPSHFGRAFRNSFGEPPHEYVIRRRVERAQGLMLSTDASLSDIALDCGLADQSHLTRLFRRIVGESPSAWRRARISAPL